jgi:hypothetical protein
MAERDKVADELRAKARACNDELEALGRSAVGLGGELVSLGAKIGSALVEARRIRQAQYDHGQAVREGREDVAPDASTA